jgi:RNA polymerase sigma-70 factor (ECF subfamily)
MVRQNDPSSGTTEARFARPNGLETNGFRKRGESVADGKGFDDDVVVIPPLIVDPLLMDAVEEAVAGNADSATGDNRPVGADPHDFAGLYIRHRSSFALHARRFLNDPRDVEEVLQEAFLRLFLAMPELETELQALSYCRRTVTNLCIDRYRADQRRPRLVDLDAIEWDPSDERSYDDPVLRAEDAAIIRQALSLLSPLHRAALVKREIEEKPLAQIAIELGVPEESVKHLLYRARRALRRLLVGTSVEPGADLSNTEILRLANERLARATLRSTNVLIVLFVATVAVVGGFRDLGKRNGSEAVSGGSIVSAPAAPAPQPTTVAPRHHRRSVPATHAKTHQRPPHPASVTAPAPAAPMVSHAAPVHRRVDHWTTLAPRPRASQPTRHPVVHTQAAYRLTGVIASTGPGAISHEVTLGDGTATTAVSRFVAPLRGAAFALDQTVILQPSSAPVLQLQATVSIDNGADVAIPLAAPAPSVATSSDDTVAIAGVGASADGSTAVNVLLVYDATLHHVLSETVGVSQLAITGSDTASASSTTSPSSDTTLPEANSPADGDDPAASSTSGTSEVGGFSTVPSTTPLEGGGGLTADR